MNERQERLIKMFVMRVHGATFKTIGDAFGISKQAVRENLVAAISTKPKYSNFVYPYITDWMIRNKRTPEDMAAEIGISEDYFKSVMAGYVGVSGRVFKRVLEITELPVNKAFEMEGQEC